MNDLDCHVYYDSTRTAVPPADGAATRVDLHADPAAGHDLIRLGLSPATDLPAMVMTEPGGKIRLVALRLNEEEMGRLIGGAGLGTARLTVFSTAWCPDCRRAKRVLEDAQASFEEVNIDQDAHAEALVLERSGGRRVVPTLRFDDRLWAFNPDPPLLRRLLSGRAAGGATT